MVREGLLLAITAALVSGPAAASAAAGHGAAATPSLADGKAAIVRYERRARARGDIDSFTLSACTRTPIRVRCSVVEVIAGMFAAEGLDWVQRDRDGILHVFVGA